MIYDFFKNLLLLSLSGAIVMIIFILSLSITQKKFSASWHFLSCKFILIMFAVPFFKFIVLPNNYIQNTAITSINNITMENIDNNNSIVYITFLIWFLGFSICLSSNIYSYIKLKKSIHLNNCYIEKKHSLFYLAENCKKKLKIDKNINIQINDSISSPLLIGIFNPTIIFTSNISKEIDPKFVMMHELMHFKRRDLWIKFTYIFITAIHWFNPFIYILGRYLNEWCETSCDEIISKNFSSQERKDYAYGLLHVAKKNISTSLIATFANDADFLKLRLSTITNNKKYTFRNSIFSVIVVCIFLFIPTFFISITGINASANALDFKKIFPLTTEMNKIILVFL